MNRVLELETILIGLRMLYGINGDAISNSSSVNSDGHLDMQNDVAKLEQSSCQYPPSGSVTKDHFSCDDAKKNISSGDLVSPAQTLLGIHDKSPSHHGDKLIHVYFQACAPSRGSRLSCLCKRYQCFFKEDQEAEK